MLRIRTIIRQKLFLIHWRARYIFKWNSMNMKSRDEWQVWSTSKFARSCFVSRALLLIHFWSIDIGVKLTSRYNWKFSGVFLMESNGYGLELSISPYSMLDEWIKSWFSCSSHHVKHISCGSKTSPLKIIFIYKPALTQKIIQLLHIEPTDMDQFYIFFSKTGR